MKIAKLVVKNFGPITLSGELSLGPRPYLMGPNGAGKSSVLDAISWCLTGRCRGVNERGEGQKDLITHGTDDMAVSVTLVVKRGTEWKQAVITRTISRTESANCNIKPDVLHKSLGVNEGTLRAALSSDLFFNLDHAAAKSLLMGVLDVRVKASQLPALGPLPAPLTLAELDAKYKAAFDERTDVKRTLVDLPTSATVDGDAVGTEYVPGLAGTLKIEWSEATTAYDRAYRELSGNQRAYDQVSAEIARAEKALGMRAALVAERVQQQAVLDEHAAIMVDEPIDDLTRLIAGADVKRKELERTIIPLKAFKPSLTTFSAGVEVAGTCVLGAGIPCHTAADEFTAKLADLEAHLDRLNAGVPDLQVRLAAVRDATRIASGARHRLDTLGQHIGAADEAAQRLDEYKATAATLRTVIETGTAAVTATKAVADAAEQAYLAARDAETRATTFESLKKAASKRVKLEARLAVLEGLCEQLGPNGVRVTALADALAAFEASINLATAPYGFHLTFSTEPWAVMVAGRDGVKMRFSRLSRGEQIRVAAAFQIALSKASGLRFFCVDNLDAIDPHGREVFTHEAVRADVDQILVAQMTGDVGLLLGDLGTSQRKVG